MPLAPPEPAVDIEAMRAQAQALLDEAARNAETLLADAHERARALVEDAAARADAIAQDARAQGHDEGFAAGRAEAEREMDDMLATMRELLEMARIERRKLHRRRRARSWSGWRWASPSACCTSRSRSTAAWSSRWPRPRSRG